MLIDLETWMIRQYDKTKHDAVLKRPMGRLQFQYFGLKVVVDLFLWIQLFDQCFSLMDKVMLFLFQPIDSNWIAE